MSQQTPPETRDGEIRSERGNPHHIEKGWTVYDAAERPIGNVTEIDAVRDVLEIDGRLQGFEAYEIPLSYVERAADNGVYLTRTVDTAPGALGGPPRFVDGPASPSASRSKARTRTEPAAAVTNLHEPAANMGATTTTTARTRPVGPTTSPLGPDTLHEFTPAYATTDPVNTNTSWRPDNENGWTAKKIAMAGLALGGLAASAYVMRRRMRRKSAFERFMDLAGDYSGVAGNYAGVATEFARQRHPAWWASLAAAAIPLAYYAWPSSKPTYTEQARGRADDFASYLPGLTGALPSMSDFEMPPSWQRSMHAMSWSLRPDVAGTVGALAAGAFAVYLIRRLTAKAGTHTRIADVMTRQPRVIQPDATVADAAAMMRRLNVGALPVCDGTRLIGMLTDRDITTRSTADGRDPHLTPVRDVMSPGVAWATEDDFVEEAARIMREHRIRRLPIVDERHSLVGVISLGDLAVDVRDDNLSGDTLEAISEPGGPARDW